MNQKVENLESALLEAGFIDERPILDESDMFTRLLSTPPVNELPEQVVNECIHRWWSLSH
jgi:hypothetical protein